MLHIFDIDGCLIRGFLETSRCPDCHGEGRHPVYDSLSAENMQAQRERSPLRYGGYMPCARCKGKGFKFGKHLPYEHVEVLPGVCDKLAELAKEPYAHFALATNQGGVAMGYQTEDEVFNKMGRVIRALGFFYGKPMSLHVAMHHPNATVEGWNDPELCKLRKPLPGMLEAAMAAHHFAPGKTVFVGDLATDRDAAEAAGVRFEWAQDFFGGHT